MRVQLDRPTREDVECLSKLLATIGLVLDSPRADNTGRVDKGQTNQAKRTMDTYFQRIQTLSKNNRLESRLRFMLQVIPFDQVPLLACTFHFFQTLSKNIRLDKVLRFMLQITVLRWECTHVLLSHIQAAGGCTSGRTPETVRVHCWLWVQRR